MSNYIKRIKMNLKSNGMKVLIQKLCFFSLLKLGQIFHTNFPISRIIKRYKKLIKNATTVEEIYESVLKLKYLHVNIKPLQVKSEILTLLNEIKKIQSKIIVEIGTNKGGTLSLFANISTPPTKIISIDLPYGEFGGGYPEWKIPLYKSFAKKNQEIVLFQVDSHQKSTLEMLKAELQQEKIDFLFIDGDHRYEGIKQDFEFYSPLVRSGGIIAFHDIVIHKTAKEVNVHQFWNEVKKDYKYIENVENWDQGSCGIGILFYH